jgi:hypothetical protein
MRTKRYLLLTLFFLGACCQTDTLQEGGGIRPRLEGPEPPPAVFANPGVPGLVDLVPRSLERIPVGTVIGREAPRDWTNLVLFATPTLSDEDVRNSPKMATHYARMFKFTLLANVVGVREGTRVSYKLQRLARGFAIDINGRETVVDGKNTLGADLGLFGKRILAENEAILDKDAVQVARTDTMLVFDAQATMLFGKDHVKRVMRHAIVVDPDSGRLATFVWLLTRTPSGYAPSEGVLQLLPPNMQEARLLHVLKDRFTLGIPSPDAFALVRIPQGTSVPYTPQLQQVATTGSFTRENALALESALRAVVWKSAP